MEYMRSPAFQFYPSNYLGSRAVRLMDAEQRGWYTQLLFESWESEPQATLPNDDALLRTLAGVNTCSVDVEQRWNFVKAQFKSKGKLIYNARLLEEFAKQDEFREKRREAGKASGEARRSKREAVKIQHLSGNGNKKSKSNTRSTSVPLCSDSVRTNNEHNRTLNTPTPTQSQDSISREKKEEAHAGKPRSLSRPKLCDEDYIKELQSDAAYTSLNVQHVYDKMVRYCKERGKQATRRRLVAWLNSEDPPIGNGNGSNKTNPQNNGTERSDFEIKFKSKVC